MDLVVALLLAVILTLLFGLIGYLFAKIRTRNIGEPKVVFEKSEKNPFVVIFAVSLVVIFFAFARPFLPLYRGMLVACAAFCVFTNICEFYFHKFDGIYSDLLILNGKLYYRKNFADFPSFGYENAEEFIQHRTIWYVTKKGHTKQMIFKNTDDCRKAVDILKNWI